MLLLCVRSCVAKQLECCALWPFDYPLPLRFVSFHFCHIRLDTSVNARNASLRIPMPYKGCYLLFGFKL